MLDSNVDAVLKMIQPHHIVLDIGGWARCFNRANYVIDAERYETRGWLAPAQGGSRELFTSKTWIQRDICDKEPYPFPDKFFDFVTCSQTLEDVRDPLCVCAEIIRIGKRGYIEVPSRVGESCRGAEPGQVGLTHHRWLIDIIPPDEIRFLMKYHMIHSHWRFSFPGRYWRNLSDTQRNQWLFWDEGFRFSETIVHTPEKQAQELEKYVQSVRPYPDILLRADKRWRQVKFLGKRARGRLRRALGRG